jgi:hypothetical protein
MFMEADSFFEPNLQRGEMKASGSKDGRRRRSAIFGRTYLVEVIRELGRR